ncbi:hypothetical protein [Caudoviricetes sp.]|nr:hypothetical protein [Caudoviricetes sp.]UOF82758.1 hypothetical protein [Caudoviricetes sp.]
MHLGIPYISFSRNSFTKLHFHWYNGRACAHFLTCNSAVRKARRLRSQRN